MSGLNLNKKPQEESFVKKQEEPEKRKLFANKKANIAIGVIFGIFVVTFIALMIYAKI